MHARGALGERVADQVIGDAVEQRSRQASVLRQVLRLELDAFPAVLAAERVPPGLRGHVGFSGGVRALQLGERLGQPLGDQRQLPPDQRLQLRGIAVMVARRDRAEHVQRLQQVLDVVRHARAGLVHRLDIARLPQLLLAQLRHVELAEQLAEQVQVPEQRRAQAVARVDAQRNGAVLEVDGMRRALAFFAARLGGFPAHAGHRRQAREAAERLDEKAFRARFALQQLGEEMQPLLHRQADGEEVAHEEHVQPGEPAARVPRQPDEQHRTGGQEHGIGERFQIAGSPQRHEGEAAQDHDDQQQHQEHAVEEIDHLRRIRRLGLRRKRQNEHERKRQQIFGGAADLGADFRARGDLGQDHHREQREKIRQHHQVAQPLPARVVLVDLAAHESGEHHHPEREQPPVERQHDAKRDQRKDEALHRRDALLGAQERLPQQQQAEVHEEERARPWVGDAAEHRDVKRGEHRRDHQAPIVLAESPDAVGQARKHRLGEMRGLH